MSQDERVNSVDRRAFLRSAAATTGALLTTGGVALAATPVRHCRTITRSGRYELDANLDHTGDEACIEIVADDVVLDGKEHKIEGKRAGTGVLVTGSNVVVKDLVVLRVETGVRFSDATNGRLQDLIVTENVGSGVRLDQSDENTVVRIISRGNQHEGIRLDRSDGNLVRESTIRENATGIALRNARNNDLLDNVICANRGEQITVGPGSTGNTWPGTVTGCTVRAGREITTPGTYTLETNLTHTGHGACIEVSADDVVLDGRGFTITGKNNGVGVFVTGSNVTVEDCSLTGLETGVHLSGTTNNVIRNVAATGNTGSGVVLTNATRNAIDHCTARGNQQGGIELESANGNVLRRNVIRDTPLGVRLRNSNVNDLIQNTLCRTTDPIVVDSRSRANTRYENVLSCTADPARLEIVEISADDTTTENSNMDDEYVVFENSGGESLDLTGWVVDYGDDVRAEPSDKPLTYEFPDGFTLRSGETVTLRTGRGNDTESDLWAGFYGPTLRNYGDTVSVYDANGIEVLEVTYTGWE